MNTRVRNKLFRRKKRIQKRLDKSDLRGCSKPMITASNIRYEIGERGGIGAMHLLVCKLGLAEAAGCTCSNPPAVPRVGSLPPSPLKRSEVRRGLTPGGFTIQTMLLLRATLA